MYFVTGGAFNGKSKWVKAYHQITSDNCSWFSAYQLDPFPQSFSQEMKGFYCFRRNRRVDKGMVEGT